MVLTKQDLQEWNSHPVTQQIFKEINEAIIELKSKSCVRDTADKTAMQTALSEGMVLGASILKESYEDLLEATE
tara:strand:- start:451 stop:672 length:222 start_codon:yes stop_codon:yes gene_type:complete